MLLFNLGFLFSLDRPPTTRSAHQPPHQPPVPPQRPGPASFGGRSATVCSCLNTLHISYPRTFLGVQCRAIFIPLVYEEEAIKTDLNSVTGWPLFKEQLNFMGEIYLIILYSFTGDIYLLVNASPTEIIYL